MGSAYFRSVESPDNEMVFVYSHLFIVPPGPYYSRNDVSKNVEEFTATMKIFYKPTLLDKLIKKFASPFERAIQVFTKQKVVQ